MTTTHYPAEILGGEDDDGTMPENVEALRQAVVGSRIVNVEKDGGVTIITLDSGKRVKLLDTSDCCAFTALEAFLLHPEKVDHAILGVGTTGEFTRWHIFADYGDILELTVGWSCGNPSYYGYGFDIVVEEIA